MHTFQCKDGFLYVDGEKCFINRAMRYDCFFEKVSDAALYEYHNVDNRLSPSQADAEVNWVSLIRIMPDEYASLKELVKSPCSPEKISGPTLIIHCREYAGQLVHELFCIIPRTSKEMVEVDEEEN